ncbi:MAG: hypothetical protein JNN12_12560 [Bacteroidetes Order II. Incertae sedis bacterium]|nr:hypothetical protein [Bacteroidetes Order II. bacterium]
MKFLKTHTIGFLLLACLAAPLWAAKPAVLVNKTSETIFYLRYQAQGANEWSEDLMASDQVLENEASLTVNISEATNAKCVFTFRATDLAGSTIWQVENQNICRNKTVTFTPETRIESDEGDEAGGDKKAITFQNETDKSIFYLYLRPKGESEWGQDSMGAGQVISGNETEKVFLSLKGGCYFDIKGTDLEEKTLFVWEKRDLCEDDTFVISDSDLNQDDGTMQNGPTFTLENKLGETIFYVYARAKGDPDWGADLLDLDGVTNTISDGSSHVLRLPLLSTTNCVFDLKVKGLSDRGEIKTYSNVDLCANETVTFNKTGKTPKLTTRKTPLVEEVVRETPAATTGQEITVTNQVGETIFYLFARPSGSEDWGQDLLENAGETLYTFQHEESGALMIPGLGQGNCKFDFKGTRLNESEVLTVKNKVDLCRNNAITFTLADGVTPSAPDEPSELDEEGDPITLTNQVGETIFYLYVRPAGSGTWSGDLLANAGDDLYTFQDQETGSLKIPGLRAGNCRFDLKATRLDESQVLSTKNNVDLCLNTNITLTLDPGVTPAPEDDGGDPAPEPEEEPIQVDGDPINVSNATGETIFYLQVRPAGTQEWSEDLLENAGSDLYTFQDGESGSLRIPGLKRGNCEFDLRGTRLDDTRSEITRMNNVDLCRNANVRFTLTESRPTVENNNSNPVPPPPVPSGAFDYGRVTFENATNGDALMTVRVRPKGTAKFTEVYNAKDADAAMGANGQVNLSKFNGECVFDIRAVGLEATYEKMGVDICRSKKIRVTTSDKK